MARKAKTPVVSEIIEEVIETVETVETVETEEEEVVEQSTGPSLLSSLVPQLMSSEVKQEEAKRDKNQGVGLFIRKLIAEGLTNKEVLAIVHEQYGNKNTTYACVAWYRNKMKKAGEVQAKNSSLDLITKFLESSEDKLGEGDVGMVRALMLKVA